MHLKLYQDSKYINLKLFNIQQSLNYTILSIKKLFVLNFKKSKKRTISNKTCFNKSCAQNL